MNNLSLYKWRWDTFISEVNFVLKAANGEELTNFDKEIIIERLEMTKLAEKEISVFSKAYPMPKAVEKIVYDYLDQKGGNS